MRDGELDDGRHLPPLQLDQALLDDAGPAMTRPSRRSSQVLHALDLDGDRLQLGPAYGAAQRPALAVRAAGGSGRQVLPQDLLDPAAYGVGLVALADLHADGDRDLDVLRRDDVELGGDQPPGVEVAGDPAQQAEVGQRRVRPSRRRPARRPRR